MKTETNILVQADSLEDAIDKVNNYMENTELNSAYSTQSAVRMVSVLPDIQDYRANRAILQKGRAEDIISKAKDFIDGKDLGSPLFDACAEYYLMNTSNVTPYKEYHNIEPSVCDDYIPIDPDGWYVVCLEWQV